MSSESEKKSEAKASGLVAELEPHKFVLGSMNQADVYLKTHKALCDGLGKHWDKSLRILVQKEEEPEFPAPAALPASATETEKEMRQVEIKMLLEDKRRYQRSKSNLFAIIMGMCNSTLRNKLEGLATYDDLDKADDVVGLLTKIKELVYSTDNSQYKYWVMQNQMTKLHSMKMSPNESVEQFSHKFLEQVKVTEASWGGPLIPREAHGKATDVQDSTRNKYYACLFLAGVDKGRYKKALDELNNDFLLGKINYPEDVAGMIKILTNRKGDGGSKVQDALKDGMTFTQSGKSRCENCKRFGHKTEKCWQKKKDDQKKGNQQSQSGTDDGKKKGTVGWHGFEILPRWNAKHGS